MHLGIDFGTSYTKLGYFQDQSFVNLAGEGVRIPSVVTYLPSRQKLYFGNMALRLDEPGAYTAYFFKLELKRNPAFKLGPFELPAILLQFFSFLKNEYVDPADLALDSITISIPNYFGLNSRRILLTAVQESFGIRTVQLLPEPIAAVIGYNISHPLASVQGDILSIDIGGGTTDFSFLSLSQERQEIIMETQLQIGNDAFSGSEIDRGVLRYLLFPAFRMQSGQKLPDRILEEKSLTSRKKYTLNRLLRLAEKVKIDISNKDMIYLNSPDFYDGHSLLLSVSGDMFLSQLIPIYQRLQSYINESLQASAKNLALHNGHEWNLDSVLLLGGASKSRGVRTLIERLFPAIPVICPEDSDFNVVKGLCSWTSTITHPFSSIKTIYPFHFYIEKFDRNHHCNSLEIIPFDTSNLEMELQGRYKIFSFSIFSDYNIAADSDNIRCRIYEVAAQDNPASVERFMGQEIVLQLDMPQKELPEIINVYLNLESSILEMDISQQAKPQSKIEQEDILHRLVPKQKDAYKLMENHKFHKEELMKDFARHLSELGKRTSKPFEAHAETTQFKLLCLLQLLNDR